MMGRRINMIFVVFIAGAVYASALRSPESKNPSPTLQGTGNDTGKGSMGNESWNVVWPWMKECLGAIVIAAVAYIWPNPRKGPSTETTVSGQLRRLVRNGKLNSRALDDRDEKRLHRLVYVLLFDRKMQFVSWWAAPFTVSSWNHLATDGLARLNDDLKNVVTGMGNTENLKERCDRLATVLLPDVRELEPIKDKMHKIVRNLYLGSYATSIDAWLLHKFKIERVVRIGGEEEHAEWQKAGRTMVYHKVVLEDYKVTIPGVEESSIHASVDQAMDFIYKAVKVDRVSTLVHCFAGRIRSVTIVAAFLLTIAEPEITVDDAMLLIKAKRPYIEPAKHFKEQLKDYVEKDIMNTRRGLSVKYGTLERTNFNEELIKIKQGRR